MRKNKQNNTEPNNIVLQTDPYLKLNEKMRQAVDMRLENIGLKDIAAKLNIEYMTARWYFTKSGPCYEAYQHMRKLQLKDRRKRLERISKEIEEIAVDAIIVIKDLIRNPKTPAIVKANVSIKALEMAGFGAILKHEDVTESEGVKLLKELMQHDERKLKNIRDRKSI